MVKTNLKAHLALLLTQFFFAVNFSVVKFLFNSGFVKPFALNLLRIAITTALLWVLFLFKKDKVMVKKEHLGRFFLCALTGIALNQLLFIKGLSYTYSIHAALLMLTTPILIVFFAAWLLSEKFTSSKGIGLVLGVAGAAILILSKETSGTAINPMLGDMLIILNAISYTFYFILVKPLMKVYTPVTIIRVIFTMGLVITLPFCVGEFLEISWPQLTAKAYLALFSVIILGTFVTYLFTAYGIKKLGASVAGAYIYVQPVFAAIIAYFILSEQITVFKFIAGTLIATGIYFSNRKA